MDSILMLYLDPNRWKYFQNADCDPSHTLHVDAFLYDEDMVDELCDTGELARNYCVDCSSHNTQPISMLNYFKVNN